MLFYCIVRDVRQRKRDGQVFQKEQRCQEGGFNMSKRHLTLKALIRQQIGKTTIPIDRMIKARKKGWRRSKTGHLYYEGRANRSDVVPAWRL